MALYCIGDVQGCDDAFGALLQKIDFSASRDTLYLLGDLVNRGPQSAAVLRRVIAYGNAAQCLLGNHDLNLLAIARAGRSPHRRDTLGAVLQAADREALLEWLGHQRLALQAHGLLMVHAGVLPQWDCAAVLRLAGEAEGVLRGPDLEAFLLTMYGNEPAQWDEALRGPARLRVIVNALTRLRFCTAQGVMDMAASGSPDDAPPGFLPWFDVPGRRTEDTPIAFGHWSTLGYLQRPNLISLDTGCVWGGCLSAIRLGAGNSGHELIQVHCEASQTPGQ